MNCCIAGIAEADKGYVTVSSMRLGALGDTCSDAKANQETFQRLSQKTDKSAETRRNAANNAAYWGQEYQNCLNQKALATAVSVQQQADNAAAALSTPTGTSTPTVSSGLNWNTILLYGGGAIAAALLLYMVTRRKSQ